MFLYSLLALAVVTALIFAAPLKAKVWATLAVVAAGALWASATAVGVLAGGHTVRLWATDVFLFGSDAGSMDPLSALFALIVSVGAVAAVLYSRGYLAHYLGRKSPTHISLHYTALATMFYAMLGVVTSEGGFSFLFFWELMTVASFLLILFDAERREVRRAALAYVIMMHVGFALLLIGFVRLDSVCGSADFALLGEYFRTQPALPLFVVFLAGFGMKAGMFPMHVWLPEAHPAAPSHVSALMSGVMIKTGVYGILRVTAQIADLPTLRTAGLILLVAGIVTGLWGVILAAAQNDVKRLLAYSSIENIGIVLIGLGIAALGKSSGNQLAAICGLSGALLHTLNHSLFKSLLFFGAGNILSQTHTTSLDALGGLGRHMPVTGLLFLAGTTAICALLPLNGFVSELLIYLGMLDGIASGSDVLASAAGLAALALIGGVVILAFTKLYGTVFLGAPRTHEVAEASEVDNFRIAAMALPLAGCHQNSDPVVHPAVSQEKELKELQKYISRYLQEAQWCNDFLDVKILLSLSINNQIYNCLITCSSNSDMKFNQTVFLYDFPLSLSIGSYADQTKLMIDNPSEADNKSILLQRAENYISDIIQIDTQILKFGFPVVGGDIYSIVLDKNGNIETYINGINTNF